MTQLSRLTCVIGDDATNPAMSRLLIYDGDGDLTDGVDLELRTAQLTLVDRRQQSVLPLQIRDERPEHLHPANKWLVFGVDGLTLEFSHIIVMAPNATKAMSLAEAVTPLAGTTRFRAIKAMPAVYLRQLANDVDIARLPESQVWDSKLHNKLKYKSPDLSQLLETPG